MSKLFLITLLAFAAVGAVADTCNPLNTRCPPNIGLANSTYTIDFTQQTTIPPDWTLSNYANLNFSSKGAEFTVAKRFDSPQLATNFYIHYGRTQVVAQVASGTGIVSSAVLLSDDLDEIDLEFSGNNFGDTVSKGQNNYYGKFHTYTVDWTSTALTWSVDGTIVRTLYAANADNVTHQYPQTPAKFQLGIWAAGDYGNAWGTVSWAGGYTDYTQAPFTMYVKSVQITNYNPAYAYNYTDNSGSSGSIKYLSAPAVSPSSTTSTPTSSTGTQTKSTGSSSVAVKVSTTCSGIPPPAPTQNGIVSGCTQWYTAKSGDTCLGIAAKFNISNEQFMAWNPAVDPPLCYNMWLNYGYCVSTDCALVSASSTSVSTTVSTSSSRSTSVSTSASSVSTITVSSTPLPTTTISPTSSISTSKTSSASSSPMTTLQGSSLSATSRSSTSITASLPSSSSALLAVVDSQSATTASSSVASSSTTPGPLCPDADGQSLANRGSNAYTIKCASDSSKASYTSAYPLHSYLDCLSLCDEAADTGCTAFTYVGNSNGDGSGICYLKSASGTFSSAPNNYISGVLSANNSSASNASSGSMTSSSAIVISSSSVFPLASPSAILCPDAATQSFITSQNGSLYFMRCSSDTNIGSYSNSKASASWKDCMNSCDSDSRCVAFTYVGGNGGIGSGQCWYKDALGSAVVAGPNYVAGFLAVKAQSSGASGSSIATSNLAVSSGSPTASSSTSSTSTASTSWAINSAGSNYTLFKNSDTNYGAYANVPATNSFMDCTTACDKDPKCTAWTYVGGSSGQGSGICWLKSQLGQPVPSNSNVISGSRLTQSVRMRRAVSSWWNSITSVKPTATEIATTIPKPPPQPAWARYYGGRWMWNGHGDWDWAWN
ncbi:concanavalin A-like lectin/glucanase [Aureobasidium sp. EXF-12298]|nr:concanavalin A-like lectin/glucanase [Aureobasidium sp. EXF-12298]KAI4766071.1 concanavalin A-like lectin/glucanase [Aureobasidium sp. EXF-12344]KAI4783654.1 concanavalin A-like lectin/glucanase [Aureobasidium sp. EXF-3400]